MESRASSPHAIGPRRNASSANSVAHRLESVSHIASLPRNDGRQRISKIEYTARQLRRGQTYAPCTLWLITHLVSRGKLLSVSGSSPPYCTPMWLVSAG